MNYNIKLDSGKSSGLTRFVKPRCWKRFSVRSYREYKDEIRYISISKSISLRIILSWYCPYALYQCWKKNHACAGRVPIWRRSRRHDIGKQAAFCTMVMLPRTMLIPGSLFLWRVRIMGLFIRSPLVTEVSYVQWSWFIHFSWLIPPCRFHIHHISVLYRLQSYSTLMDFFSVALLISLVSWVYVTVHRWIIRSSHYAVFFFRDWLFCSDTLSVFLLARMFHPCHGSFFFSNKYRCSCSLLRQNNYLIS